MCICEGLNGIGTAKSKVKAKKKAAYALLIHLFAGAGIKNKEWDSKMFEYLYGEKE